MNVIYVSLHIRKKCLNLPGRRTIEGAKLSKSLKSKKWPALMHRLKTKDGNSSFSLLFFLSRQNSRLSWSIAKKSSIAWCKRWSTKVWGCPESKIRNRLHLKRKIRDSETRKLEMRLNLMNLLQASLGIIR